MSVVRDLAPQGRDERRLSLKVQERKGEKAKPHSASDPDRAD